MKKQLMGAAVASIVTIGAIGTIGAIQTINIDTYSVPGITQLSAETKDVSVSIKTDATEITLSVNSDVKIEVGTEVTATVGETAFVFTPTIGNAIPADADTEVTFKIKTGVLNPNLVVNDAPTAPTVKSDGAIITTTTEIVVTEAEVPVTDGAKLTFVDNTSISAAITTTTEIANKTELTLTLSTPSRAGGATVLKGKTDSKIEAGATGTVKFTTESGATIDAGDYTGVITDGSSLNIDAGDVTVDAEEPTDAPATNYLEKNIALDFVGDTSDNGVINIDPALGTDLVIYADPSQEAKEAGEIVTSVDVILNGTELDVTGTPTDEFTTSVWTTTIAAEDIINGKNTLDIVINTSIEEVETQGLTLNHTFKGNGLSGGAIAGIVIGSLAVVGLIAGGGYYFYTTKGITIKKTTTKDTTTKDTTTKDTTTKDTKKTTTKKTTTKDATKKSS